MDLRFVRVGFVIISALFGSQFIGQAEGWPFWLRIPLAAGAGALLVLLEAAIHRIGRVSVRGSSAAVFGMLFGLIMAKLVADAITLLPFDPITAGGLRVSLTWAFCYLGMAMALRGRDEFSVIIPYVRLARHDRGEDASLVDTSAIIDGRLLDLCKTRFIEGRLLIPRFVLKELQTVADSADPIKRSRGRRGLEVLNQLRQLTTVDVRIHEEDLPGIPETDAKLVKLAQVLSARVITNDFNLNKVAEFQNVSVLNVNELAQALRPVVLPGEALEVKPIKEGKEHHQAVAYLDDGTMVVVENGRALIGQSIRGIVTSVLQTSAGRMVFVRPDGAPAPKR
ncbi:MAG: PIN domain nuclease [Candidatus Omnitrophica bacterium]|nr:PIN domain nuclease [Candidatus Omnitrophota bacterium]